MAKANNAGRLADRVVIELVLESHTEGKDVQLYFLCLHILNPDECLDITICPTGENLLYTNVQYL